jgi:hypothetical protein
VKAKRDASRVRERRPESNWTELHAHYATMGGFVVKIPSEGSNHSNYCSFTVEQLLDTPSVVGFPTTTAVEIMDKSKTDEFVKAFALAQILWLVVQSAARAIQGLAVSTLEISTICYIPCTVATYYFWWHKPYDVSSVVLLNAADTSRPVAFELELQRELLSRGSNNSENSFLRTPIAIFKVFLEVYLHESRYADRRKSQTERWSYGNLLSLTSLAFGGLHCMAWNFDFASLWEKWAWRTSCILIGVCLPSSWVLTVAGAKWLDLAAKRQRSLKAARTPVRLLFQVLQAVCIGLYICARLFLLFEVFFSLRALPASCYNSVDWSQFLPHV